MAHSFSVGQTFRHVRECDKYRPIYYAAVSGDFNPIHIDPEVGAMAGLGGNILQGLCTMSWAVEAFTRFIGNPTGIKKAHVRFAKPVFIDDTLTFEGVITEVDGPRITAKLSAKNQRGEEVLKNAELTAEVRP